MNAPFLSPDFNADNHRIWTYLVHRCRETPIWACIQQYQETNNGRQTWLALRLCYGRGAAHNDGEVGGIEVLKTELSYEDEDYKHIDHKDPKFDDVYGIWRGAHLMISKKIELEAKLFTGSDYQGNIHGYNPNPGKIYPEQAREMKKGSTLNAPNNLSSESLVVLAKRASELMDNNRSVRPYTTMLLKTYSKMGIVSNNDLYVILNKTRDDLELKAIFMNQFKEISGGFVLSYKQVSFFRCASMYMDK